MSTKDQVIGGPPAANGAVPAAPRPAPGPLRDPVFVAKNARRCELIHRKYLAGGITPDEEAELAILEEETDAILEPYADAPMPDAADLEYALRKLRSGV